MHHVFHPFTHHPLYATTGVVSVVHTGMLLVPSSFGAGVSPRADTCLPLSSALAPLLSNTLYYLEVARQPVQAVM